MNAMEAHERITEWLDRPRAAGMRWRWMNHLHVIEFVSETQMWCAILKHESRDETVYGVGETPDAALIDLAERLKQVSTFEALIGATC